MNWHGQIHPIAKRGRALAAAGGAWWLAELRGMVPAAATRALGTRSDDDFLLLYEGESESFWRRQPGADDFHALSQPENPSENAGGIVLCLTPAMVFETRLSLPLEAERNLKPILRHQTERLVPLDIADIEIAWRILSRDVVSKTLDIGLTVIKRATIAQAIASALRYGLQPEKLAIGAPLGSTLRPAEVPLALPATPRRRRTYLRHGLNAAIVLAILGLYGVHLERLSAIKDHLSAAVGEARQAASAAKKKRDEATELRKIRDFLDERQAVPPLRVLDALTTLLPDDTWIFTLDIDSTTVSLQGDAANAAGLIGLFESHSLFGNPKFRSPITGIEGDTGERFNLSVTLRPHGGGA